MWLHFDRHGKFRGYSTGLGLWIAAGVVVLIFVLATGRALFYLAPFIALWALVIWLARPLFRRHPKQRSQESEDAASR